MPFQQNSAPFIYCAHEGCPAPAIFRIKTPAGIANLCHAHYDKYYTDQAHARLPKYGMERKPGESSADWIKRMRVYVVKTSKKIGRIYA
jgi:hypothetical protein